MPGSSRRLACSRPYSRSCTLEFRLLMSRPTVGAGWLQRPASPKRLSPPPLVWLFCTMSPQWPASSAAGHGKECRHAQGSGNTRRKRRKRSSRSTYYHPTRLRGSVSGLFYPYLESSYGKFMINRIAFSSGKGDLLAPIIVGHAAALVLTAPFLVHGRPRWRLIVGL